MLENLHNSEQVRNILDNCGSASEQLSGLMVNLSRAMQNSSENNRRIESEADKTMIGCENTLQHVRSTTSGISDMERLMNEVLSQTDSMNASMKQTREAVFGNERNVSDGIKEIGRARDEATEILELQSRSNRTVMETQKNIRESAEHQSMAADSAFAMEGVANSSIEQVQSIQSAIERRKELVLMMEDAFAQVSEISEKLLEISRSEV